MLDYLKFYLAPLVQVIGGVGIYMGGNYMWAGLATLPILAILDTVLSDNFEKRNMHNRLIADIPLVITALLGIGLLFLLAWKISVTPDLTTLQMVGGALSLGWLGTVASLPATHELFHEINPIRVAIGIVGQFAFFDVSRHISHNNGHHLDVASSLDADTAKRGENIYKFAVETGWQNHKESFRLEAEALKKRGKSPWSLSNFMYRAVLILVVLYSGIYYVGGETGLLYVLLAQGVARLWIEGLNYFQHCGLIRVNHAPIQHYHVWNHLKPISRVITFEITNHCDHHQDAFMPYYEMTPDKDSVRLPGALTCFAVALIPPIWFNFILKPALKEWDNRFANDEEKELARAANKAAGWEDWIEKK